MISYFLLYFDPQWAPLLLRAVLGAILMVHGRQKTGTGFAGFSALLGSLGFRPASLWASAVTILELVGGLFLVVGFLTHFVAFALAIEFLVITCYVKRKNSLTGDGGRELDLLILALAISLLFSGPGAWALDGRLGLLFF